MNKKHLIIFTGGIVGILGVLLVAAGNPANMGYCIPAREKITSLCFIKNNSTFSSLSS